MVFRPGQRIAFIGMAVELFTFKTNLKISYQFGVVVSIRSSSAIK